MSAQSVQIALDQFTTFGDLLKYLRRRSGQTQRELSIAVGYSVPQISRLEQNQRLPDLATITARFLPALQAEGEPAIAARLVELAAAVRREDAPAPGLPPYKGLLYFDEADAELFFGREALVDKLLGRVTALPGAAVRFLAVVGASGSGKSSVVRAGLIPALRWQATSAGWPVVVCTPTSHPLEALAAALAAEGKPSPSSMKLADALASDPGALLRQVAARLPANPAAPQAGLVVVVDQFEELFTLCRSETEQAAFVDNLLMATSAPGGAALAVITLRADFYAQCARFDSLREALAAQQEYIGPMTGDELRRAIEEPARLGHWTLAPGLVEVLLKDVGADGAHPPEPGALPLLSHALLETWQRRRGQTLTLSGYLASGGVRGAIAETAEAVFHDQLDAPQRAIARQIFLRLTELGAEGVTADTRRRAALRELIPGSEDGAAGGESVREVLQILADARLITTEQDTAEVAHEALIREWPTLRGWLEEDRDGLRLHRGLTEAAQEWMKVNNDADALYRGARLAQAVEWAGTEDNAPGLNALERAFLVASQQAATREAAEREAARQRELEAARQLAETETARAEAAQKLGETEKRRADEQARSAGQLRRRALYLLGAFVLAAALALAALYFGDRARQTAVTAQAAGQLATARELAADAVSNLDVDAERSVLLALQGVSVADSPETEGALHRAVLADRLQLTLAGHAGQVWSVAYSPDGKRLATSSKDHTVKIWDVASGKLLLTLTGHTDSINSVRFSPDGTRLATASDDRTAKLWDAATGQELMTLADDIQPVSRVVFSPDGRWLVTTADDNRAKLWDLSTGQDLYTWTAPNSPYVGVAISPDGARLALAGFQGNVDIFDLATHRLQQTLPSDAQGRNLAFSPDGTRLAATSGTVVRVWDVASGQLLLTLTGHTDVVRTVAYTPDGTRLISAGLDRKAMVWDAVSGRLLFTIAGHLNAINGIAISPDGQHLATASWDFTAKIWDLAPTHELYAVPQQIFAPGQSGLIALSPNGNEVALSQPDATAMVLDAHTGRPLFSLRRHSGPILGISYSPDGKLIATSSSDGTAKVWDAATGQALKTLLVPSGISAAFSPDGMRLFGFHSDHSLGVWVIATGNLKQTFVDNSGLQLLYVAISSDGTHVAIGAQDDTRPGGFLILWDLATGKTVGPLQTHASYLTSLTFNPDGTRLATSSADGTAKILDAATGQVILTLSGHAGDVSKVVFSADGKRLATASLDGTARIWDSQTGQQLLTLYGDNSGMTDVAFTPDGTRLLTSTYEAMRVYLLRLSDLVALAKSRVTRLLTTAECEQYLHVASCPASP